MFFRSPIGYFSNIFSTIHSLAFSGLIFHPELQVETTSTTDVPFLASEFSNAFLSAALVLRTAAGV